MPAHIMVFNDDQDTLDMYAMALEVEGYTLFTHRLPHVDEAAVDVAAPDLVILDWLYGHEERGFDLLRELRAYPQTAITPIIVCTASGAPRMERYATVFQHEQVDVVHKPFELEHLSQLIASRLHLTPE